MDFILSSLFLDYTLATHFIKNQILGLFPSQQHKYSAFQKYLPDEHDVQHQNYRTVVLI